MNLTWYYQILLKTNQFLVSTIFFTNINISFFNLFFGLLSIIAKKVDQISKNVPFAVARLVFLFCCALITSRCNAFQQFFKYQKESQFYGPYLQIVVFLVTMYILNNFWHWNSKCKTRWFSKFGIFSFSWKLIQVNLFWYW